MTNKPSKQGLSKKRSLRPAQKQRRQPGQQRPLVPPPQSFDKSYRGSGKLAGKVALVTGGDSGIGRSVAVLFAKEGAQLAIVYLEENQDAADTKKLVEEQDQQALLIKGDIRNQKFCQKAVAKTIEEFGHLDILINNAGEQHFERDFLKIDSKSLVRTFETNIFAMFYLTQAALPYLKNRKGAAIINSTSVTAYRGSPGLIDYSASKGAIVSFTRSLSQNLVRFGIRVNAVAPGPIWTPLIPATFPSEHVKSFGSETPMGRAGQPYESATCFVFLASDDASYMTGQVLHPNGGEIING